MFELSEQKKKLLTTDGHLLIKGGPGSGKTTIALLKAKEDILSSKLKEGQQILFLSFARATISRVEEQLKDMTFNNDIKKHININTYHSFTWSILKTHGYLIGKHKSLKLLLPHNASALFANIDKVDHYNKMKEMFIVKGIVHFDLFAELSYNLLSKSNSICNLLCDKYPIIILDEFQDTNSSEWGFIQQLSKKSTIIVLADPEQRIYDFRGATPERVDEFEKHVSPTVFDFMSENNRSAGTDIAQYGNDLLNSKNKEKSYNNVIIYKYPLRKGYPHLMLKSAILKSISRLKKDKNDWSLAILVSSNKLMSSVSGALSTEYEFTDRRLPKISHDVAIDKSALALSAVFISTLLDANSSLNDVFIHLNNYIRGRSDKLSKTDNNLSEAIEEYLQTNKLRKSKALISECISIYKRCTAATLTGNPSDDWLIVRNIITEIGNTLILKRLYNDSLYIKLLHKGSVLQEGLSETWRKYGNYNGALGIVQNALLQEHFSLGIKKMTGVQLMTIHKSKGKEFDEVILYEDAFSGKFIRNENDPKVVKKSLYMLRVGVTRAMKNTTILIPQKDGCSLL